jgi:hypothetical protein
MLFGSLPKRLRASWTTSSAPEVDRLLRKTMARHVAKGADIRRLSRGFFGNALRTTHSTCVGAAISAAQDNPIVIDCFAPMLDRTAARCSRRGGAVFHREPMKPLISSSSLIITLLWTAFLPVNAQVNVTQQHNNLSRDGVYIDSAFTPANAANLTRDLNFNGTISGNVYAQPL